MRLYAKDERIGAPIQRKTFLTPEQRKSDPVKDLRIKLIKDIVKKSLIELAISLAFTGLACFFVATPAGMATLAICAIAVFAINLLFRAGAAYCHYRQKNLAFDDTEEGKLKRVLFGCGKAICRFVTPWTFGSLVDANTRDVVTHEAGHALAAHMLIKEPRVKISIVPFTGGSTTFRLGFLTKIGELFGKAHSRAIIAAAGPALSVVTATVGYGFGLAYRKTYPEFSRELRATAISSIFNQASYAISALSASVKNKGHDFLQLWARGIHPVAAAVSMIVLPIIIRIGFFIYDRISLGKAKKIAAKEHLQERYHYMLKLPTRLTPRQQALLRA
jgi:hypothetical protein